MLLFQKRFQQGIVEGNVRTTFRFWEKPRVKPGGRYRVHPIGVVEVEALRLIRVGEITDADAKAAGFEDRASLVEYMRPAAPGNFDATTEVFRVDFHYGGDGDRIQLALEEELSDEDVEEIARRLKRLDGDEPWTRRTLLLIGKRPRTAASKLAPSFRLETLPFKERVRKLKRLGLTQSFEVGYEISPRGRAFLARRKRW